MADGPSLVLEHKPAPWRESLRHFSDRLSIETDPSDVYADLQAGIEGFLLVDPRSPEAYTQGHIPGAYNLPHRAIDRASVAALPSGRLVVLYGAGPGCNAAHKAAVRLAPMGLFLKEMLGGFWWWQSSGYPVQTGAEPGRIS